MRISKHLKTKGLDWKLIPVPRFISSDCGVCVRIRRDDIEVARETVEELRMDIQAIVEI